MAIAYYQTWYSQSLMDQDKENHFLTAKLGQGIDSILNSVDHWAPSTVYTEETSPIAYFKTPFSMSIGSNSWAVRPENSVSGHAMMASDPHLDLNRAPAFWYIAGLHSEEGTNFIGVTVPGLMAGLMGHNDSTSMAFTIAAIDLADFYEEKRDPKDSTYVLRKNGHEKIKTITEKIFIRDEQPVDISIQSTSFGLVVEKTDSTLKTMHWAGFDFNIGKLMPAVFNLSKIKNVADFRKTVTGLGALNVNWIYSDRSGNIAYQLGAPVPKRAYDSKRLLPADSAYTYTEYFPLDETPFLLNPKEGWLANSNNKVVSEKWPHSVPGYYDHYRIERARSLLNAKPKFDRKDFLEMQMDNISGLALKHKDLITSGAKKLGDSELEQAFSEWNGNIVRNDKRSVIFRYWWHFLPKALYEDQLGDKYEMAEHFVEKTIENDLTKIIDDTRTENVESIEDISANALKVALKYSSKSNVTTHTIGHPLGGIKLFDYWFNLNRGPFASDSDIGSLNQGIYKFNKESEEFDLMAGPSMRYVIDWSDMDNFSIIMSLGQSGNPFSPHYDDFLEIWQEGKEWIVPISKTKVYAKKKSILTLIPKR